MHQIKWGVCATVVTFIVVATLTLVSYWFLGYADIPFKQYVAVQPANTLYDAYYRATPSFVCNFDIIVLKILTICIGL